MKFVFKEVQKSNIVVATISILKLSWQPGHVFVMSFHPRDFVQRASNKLFPLPLWVNWLLLSHVILSQTCSKLQYDSIEDSEVDNRLEKMDFADLVKDAKSVTGFFSLPPISS